MRTSVDKFKVHISAHGMLHCVVGACMLSVTFILTRTRLKYFGQGTSTGNSIQCVPSFTGQVTSYMVIVNSDMIIH